MNNTDELRISRLGRAALIVGIAAGIASAAGAFVDRQQFLHSYLVGFLLWTGAAAGSTAILMIYHLTGGGWGLIVRRVAEAASRMLPLMALLSVPILVLLPGLYEWAHPEAVAGSELLKHKSVFLNVPFFVIRTALYFAIWYGMAFLLNRWSAEQDRTGDPRLARRMEALSGPGLVLYAVAATFASVDWIMSLEPDWFSTAFGLLFMVGQVLTAFSVVIAAAGLLSRREPIAAVAVPTKLNDLGNLMLAFVMLWAYLGFSQFLIIWAGNLPEEIIWYKHRLTGFWTAVAIFLIVFHFAAPFLLLLVRDVKRRARRLASLAVAMLVIRLIDIIWMVEPSKGGGFAGPHWMDFVVPLAMGGFWVALFVRQLRAMPLVPLNDPQLFEVELTHG